MDNRPIQAACLVHARGTCVGGFERVELVNSTVRAALPGTRVIIFSRGIYILSRLMRKKRICTEFNQVDRKEGGGCDGIKQRRAQAKSRANAVFVTAECLVGKHRGGYLPMRCIVPLLTRTLNGCRQRGNDVVTLKLLSLCIQRNAMNPGSLTEKNCLSIFTVKYSQEQRFPIRLNGINEPC